jgi:hypothetical protein
MMPNNLRLVKQAVTEKTVDTNMQAMMARDEMMMALIQLAKSEIKGRRPKGQKATSGQPPMNRTGDLRRSIRGEKYRTGFASYSAIVGPTIIYGRRVELGGGNWPSGTKFPYMEPAFQKFRSIVFPQIVAKHFKGV